MTILLVEDDAAVGRLVCKQLEERGMSVRVATTVSSASSAFVSEAFDIVLLDLNLPDGSGLNLLRQIRTTGSAVHVIILSAAATELDRVRALELGADDYVVKPFFARELTARVLAVRRRLATGREANLQIGHLDLDLEARTVTASGRPLDLTTKEFDLLAFLAARPGHVFSRDDLLRAVWRSAPEWQQVATVTEHVRRLRAKIERIPNAPELLQTVRGVGYRFDLPAADQAEAGVDPIGPRLRLLATGIATDISDALIVTDQLFQIRSWNRGAERLYGWSEPEVVGRHILDVVRWVGGDTDVATAWQELEDTGRWHGEALHVTRDGTEVRVYGSTTLSRDDHGEPVAVISVNRPVLESVGVAPGEQEATTHSQPEIEAALDGGQLEVFYQPVIALEDGSIFAVEGLLRWHHPSGRVLKTEDIIRSAQQSDLMPRLGAAVLGMACADGAAWRAQGHGLDVSVNLSASELADPGLADRVIEILERTGMDPHHLWFEVTETALVKDVEQATAILQRLTALGIRISIDDFGTGWASLTYLKRFPVHALKIDSSFVGDIDQDGNDAAIARSILSLGAELGVDVIAEGIETEVQRQALLDLGCSMGQGFLCGKPVAASEVPLHRVRVDGRPRSSVRGA